MNPVFYIFFRWCYCVVRLGCLFIFWKVLLIFRASIVRCLNALRYWLLNSCVVKRSPSVFETKLWSVIYYFWWWTATNWEMICLMYTRQENERKRFSLIGEPQAVIHLLAIKFSFFIHKVCTERRKNFHWTLLLQLFESLPTTHWWVMSHKSFLFVSFGRIDEEFLRNTQDLKVLMGKVGDW